MRVYWVFIHTITLHILYIPDTAWDTLRLCEEYRDKGVVGIDIAGCNESEKPGSDEVYRAVFTAAREKGIHRTAHAGETGGAEYVKEVR